MLRFAFYIVAFASIVPPLTLRAEVITCPNGEVHRPIRIEDLAIQYSGKSFQSTLTGLAGLGTRVSAVQVPLQQATAATQQWDEYLKGLVAGYNNCIITNAQYAEGVKSIYPQLDSDAAKIEDIRKLLASQQKISNDILKNLLDTYFKHLTRFADLAGKSEIIAAIKAGTNEIISEVRNEAVIGRVYNEPLTLLTIGVTFGVFKPEEVSLQLMTRKGPPIRFDFTSDKVTVVAQGARPFDNPVTPTMAEEAKADGRYIYFVDFEYLRRAAPSHPLATLSAASLENAPIYILVDKRAVPRLGKEQRGAGFNVSIGAEVSGYEFEVLDLSPTPEELKSSMPWPREVPGKPDFAMLIGDWRTSNVDLKVSGRSEMGDIMKGSEFLDRQSDLASWRGLWPSKDVLLLFNQITKTPVDEERIVFHPWNHRFVRLQDDFASSGGCDVPGISVFQNPQNSAFYLYANIQFKGSSEPSWEATAKGGLIKLTLEEVTTIHNILREVAVLNSREGAIEGNIVTLVIILLPLRDRYLVFSPRQYTQFVNELPKPIADMRYAVTGSVRSSLAMVGGFPRDH